MTADSAPRPLRAAAEPVALSLLALAIAALLGRLGDWRGELGRFQALMLAAFCAYALAVWRRARWRGLPGAGAFVVLVALALRAALVATPPTLSDDLYRYVWEGRVLASGSSPYAHAPLDSALATLRDAAIFPRVNHPELSAIYPPLAEAGFALVARVWFSLVAFKLWVLLHDVALCALLALIALETLVNLSSETGHERAPAHDSVRKDLRGRQPGERYSGRSRPRRRRARERAHVCA